MLGIGVIESQRSQWLGTDVLKREIGLDENRMNEIAETPGRPVAPIVSGCHPTLIASTPRIVHE